MRYILSTYNFDPRRMGGTEVYTLHLAEYLLARGNEVIIIAALDEPAPQGGQLVRSNPGMEALQYYYQGVRVVCIKIRHQDAKDIYGLHNEAWAGQFSELLKDLGWEEADHLIMNGLTTVSGRSLMEAVKKGRKDCCVHVITHTSFHCPKADMLDAYTGMRCQQTMGPAGCSKCIYRQRAGTAAWLSGFSEFMANKVGGIFSSRAAFNLRKLIELRLESFRVINGMTDHVVVFSNDMKSFLARQAFMSAEKIVMIRHGINKDLFFPPPVKPEGKTTIMYAGRFERIKGVLTLAQAWLDLEEKPGRELVMAGNWSSTETGRSVKTMLSGRGDVRWCGDLNQPELAALYREAHCVVIPSTLVETGPMVFHEAVASGCHVITSDLGGQGELAGVYHAVSRTFRTGDVNALRQQLDTFEYVEAESGMPLEVMSWADHFDQLMELFNQPRYKN